MNINPHFRTVDEIMPRIPLELQGWGDPDTSLEHKYNREAELAGKLEQDMPCFTRAQDAEPPMPQMLAKWNDFQKSKGRYDGSNDLSLIDEFAIGQNLVWLPQIIGSCVASNSFRPYVFRMMWQIIMLGKAEEYFGRNEFGPQNYSFYAAQSYGLARRRGNMRRGDGLYCSIWAESLMKDGVLLCSNEQLVQFLKGKGLARDQDFPEPQGSAGARLYREFGSWSYLDQFKPYMTAPVLECPEVTSADQLWNLLGEGKPCFVCSGEAIRKVGEHPDGFPIHARDPGNSWAHNMFVPGRFVASDGARFFRWGNESWGEQHIYNRKYEEVASNFHRLDMRAIGRIDSPRSKPPVIG